VLSFRGSPPTRHPRLLSSCSLADALAWEDCSCPACQDTLLLDLETIGIRSPLGVLGDILTGSSGVEIEISFLRRFLLTKAVA